MMCNINLLTSSAFLHLGKAQASSLFSRLAQHFATTRCCFGSEKPASSLFSRLAQHCIARYAPSVHQPNLLQIEQKSLESNF